MSLTLPMIRTMMKAHAQKTAMDRKVQLVLQRAAVASVEGKEGHAIFESTMKALEKAAR